MLLRVGIYTSKRTESGIINESLVFAALTERMDNHCLGENRSFAFIRQLFFLTERQNRRK